MRREVGPGCTNFKHLYFTAPQHLAHRAGSGCAMGSGEFRRNRVRLTTFVSVICRRWESDPGSVVRRAWPDRTLRLRAEQAVPAEIHG